APRPVLGRAALAVSAVVITAAGGDDQRLVLLRERRFGHAAVNLVGAVAVAFVLVVNLSRGEPIASLVAAVAIAAVLHRRWVKAGRPRGIRDVTAEAEAGH
ncbi:amino acid permease, partial [Streptomyces antimycoticus]